MAGRPTPLPPRQGGILVVDGRPLYAQGVATAFDPAVERVLTVAPEAAAAVSMGRGVAVVALACERADSVVGRLVAKGRLVVVYGSPRHHLGAAVAAGAAGYFTDEAGAAEVRAAVQAVRRGDTWFPPEPAGRDGLEHLTRREREVLAGLLAGLRPADIAQRDFVSVVTVRNQVQAILTKLNVHSQLEAVALAHAAGWSADAPTPAAAPHPADAPRPAAA